MENGMDRRQFLGGASLLLLGASGALAGCASSDGSEDKTDDGAGIDTSSITETKDCDVLVIGAGGSGLAAAVQASELGASVVCIESQAAVGGNLTGVEGCFGINSSMQKAKGIEIETGTTIRSELVASQFRASGCGYVDMVHASGENIDWLIEQGVQFQDVDVDKGNIMVFHRFANRGLKDYVEPMAKKAEENGVVILLNTKGQQLIKDEKGGVAGAYASNADGTLQINAKAVIVATGGFADNETFMAELGIPKAKAKISGMPGHDGSGHTMAVQAGAMSNRANTSLLAAFFVEGTPGYYENGKFAFIVGVAAPYSIWVNEKGERFVNEDFTLDNIMLMSLPGRLNKDYFIVMDSTMMNIYMNGDAQGLKQLADAIAAGSIVEAETLDALGEGLGLDAATFANTVERYNGFVGNGSDGDYGKNPQVMMPLATGPFYGIKTLVEIPTTIGSVCTDRSFHALDGSGDPIDGLYVVGVEGSMLWTNVYTINISGSCNANNVNSGRTAAKDAVSRL